MATPRAVRIPRTEHLPTARLVRVPEPGSPPAAPVDRRVNRSGCQRAYRLTMIYLAALISLYVVFVAIDRSGPGGTGPTAVSGLVYFTLFAGVLAVGGGVVAVSSTPQAVELSAGSLVVVEWWGRRRIFPPLGKLRVEVVRRTRAGFLSDNPVESVEIGDGSRGRRTYQLEEGLLPAHGPGTTGP